MLEFTAVQIAPRSNKALEKVNNAEYLIANRMTLAILTCCGSLRELFRFPRCILYLVKNGSQPLKLMQFGGYIGKEGTNLDGLIVNDEEGVESSSIFFVTPFVTNLFNGNSAHSLVLRNDEHFTPPFSLPNLIRHGL